VKAVGAAFVAGAIVAFAFALRVAPVEYQSSDFHRAGVSRAWAERQAARANRVAVALARGESLEAVVTTLEATFAVSWYASGRGPGEDSFPLRPRIGVGVSFVARDPSSPWYRRALRAMTHDAQFVGRRPAAYRTRDGRDIFAGELVEDRTGVTFRTGTELRSKEIFSDVVTRLGAARALSPEASRRELAAVLRGITLAMPYGERTTAFAEALVLGAHLAFRGETFRLPRDSRGEFDRAAWTAVDDEDFAVETGFQTPDEPRRTVSREDSGA
jgi:hypothetical protein